MFQLKLAYQRLEQPMDRAASTAFDGVDGVLLDGGPPMPDAGARVAGQLAQSLTGLGPWLYIQPGAITVASLAGHDPQGAVVAAARALVDSGNADARVSVVRGQDILGQLEELLATCPLAHAQTGQRFSELTAPIVAAVASCGPPPLQAAFDQGARVVLTAHETPAVLAEAAATLGVGQDRAKARRLGAALAEADAWLAAEATRREGWICDPLVGSLDRGAEFQGPAAASERARQYFERPGDADGADRANATIVYRTGYQTELVVQADAPTGSERFLAALQLAPRLVRDCLTGAEPPSVFQHAAIGPTSAAVALVRLSHADKQTMSEAIHVITSVVNRLGPSMGVRLIGASAPTPHFGWWPTLVPPERLEWTVETHSAGEWAAVRGDDEP